MHNFVYLVQRRSQEFSCEPNFGRGGGVPPWLRQCYIIVWAKHLRQPYLPLCSINAQTAYVFSAEVLCRASSIGSQHYAAPCGRAWQWGTIVPIQLAQCRFPGLAISNAEMLIYHSNKIYGNNFITQHSETVMV